MKIWQRAVPFDTLRRARALFDHTRHAARGHQLQDAHTGTVTSHGAEIRYYEYGPRSAEMTVVFVHGFTLAAEAFFPQVNYLRRTWPNTRLVLLDLRGHGQSSHVSPDDCRIDYAADDVLAVLHERPAAGRIIILGHSLGSPVSLAALRRAPAAIYDSVAGVIQISGAVDVMSHRGVTKILNTAPVTALFNAYRRRPSSVLRLRERISALIPTALKLFFFIRHTSDELVDFHANLIARTPTASLIGFGERLRTNSEFESLDELADKPGYILVGDKDFITPVCQSRLLWQRWPKAHFQIAPHAGHMLPLEAPGYVCATLDRLLKELDVKG